MTRSRLRLLALAAITAASTAGSSGAGAGRPTPVTLHLPPELAPLRSCIANRLGMRDAASDVSARQGIEIRWVVRGPRDGRVVVASAMLVPDLSSTLEPIGADEEDQPDAALRLRSLLRLPVGVRAWPWMPAALASVCDDGVHWIAALRSQSLALDRLDREGEALPLAR